jgi:hypothetical protein
VPASPRLDRFSTLLSSPNPSKLFHGPWALANPRPQVTVVGAEPEQNPVMIHKDADTKRHQGALRELLVSTLEPVRSHAQQQAPNKANDSDGLVH